MESAWETACCKCKKKLDGVKEVTVIELIILKAALGDGSSGTVVGQ